MKDFLIYAGPPASGKSTKLRQDIIKTTRDEPDQRIIMIVPEQSTLLTQQDLLNEHPQNGILTVEILSFNRLAWRILKETGAEDYQILDDIGKSMLLMKIAVDHQQELVYYKNHVRRQGYIGQLKIMITELFQYCIDEPSLRQIRDTLNPSGTLYRKLSDIMLILKDFQIRTSGTTIPSEELLNVLERKIPESMLLEGADIYIDGFFGFTPQQYRVIAALCGKARHVRMALTLDGEGSDIRPAVSSEKVISKLSRMQLNGRIYMMKTSYQRPLLASVSRELFRLNPKACGDPRGELTLHVARRPEEEAEWVLSSIAQALQQDPSLRYRDIAILCENETVYGSVLERLGQRYGIPLYIDRKIPLYTQPLSRMLIGMIRSVRNGFSSDTVLTWMKNPYCPLSREDTDRLENRALREGWRGLKCFQQACHEENEDGTSLPEIEEIFTKLGLLSRRQTIGSFIQIIREILELLPVEETCKEQAAWFEAHGDLKMEKICAEVPDAICSVLDQMEAVLGTEETDIQGFYDIFLSGLRQADLGSIPMSSDQIQVVNLERSRISRIRKLYVLGFQEDTYPALTGDVGLLSDRERQKMAVFHDVAADQQQKLIDGQASLGSMLGRVSENVCFSYAVNDGHGKSLRPSPSIENLMKICPGLETDTSSVQPMHPEWLLDRLSRGDYDAEDEKIVRRWLLKHGYEKAVAVMSHPMDSEIPEENLSATDVRPLFALTERPVSVTQLEQYANCPLSYFFRYGLSLKPRDVLSVRPLDDGNVLHALLEAIGPGLSVTDQQTMLISDEEIAAVMDRMIDQDESFKRYQTSSRYTFYWRKLKDTASWAVRVLNDQLKKGCFVPTAFEWAFGSGRVPAYPLVLSDGSSVLLRGKIDRIDLMKTEEQTYIRIIDYKSGRTNWQNWDVYEGLKLQLPLYMDALQYVMERSGREDASPVLISPAGMFYFHLTPRILKGEPEDSETERNRRMLRDAHLDGIMLQEERVVAGMDTGLSQAQASTVTGIRLKKDGSLAKNSTVVSKEQFDLLRKQARTTAGTLAENISSGRMSPQPVLSEGGRTACSFCDYKHICRLEAFRSPDRFRRVIHSSSEDFWETIKASSEISGYQKKENEGFCRI